MLRVGVVIAVLAFCELCCWEVAWAFPPYRSTDADTAEEGVLEVRLGLAQVERESQKNAYLSPLLRGNLGLAANLELVSEVEYRADEGEVTDAAVGFKWVPFKRSLSLGVENLLLLPVSADHDGVGVESLLLATLQRGDLLVHLDLGGFHDTRPSPTEKGWKSGVIVELIRGQFRPGLELFAKQVKHERASVQAGPGVIIDLGPLDVRSGLRVGLTREAPDLEVNLWVTWKSAVW